MERENLKSRLGFILLSAGCAIGIGNVWKFPYMAGQGGGGAFVLFYLIFLVILGLPIMTMEFAVGRASKKSPVKAYQALEKPGQKWHIHGYFTLAGCYLLMMFYTTVAGWMLHYFYMTAAGKLSGLSADAVAEEFTRMLADPGVMMFWMVLVVIIGIVVCAGGLQTLFLLSVSTASSAVSFTDTLPDTTLPTCPIRPPAIFTVSVTSKVPFFVRITPKSPFCPPMVA